MKNICFWFFSCIILQLSFCADPTTILNGRYIEFNLDATSTTFLGKITLAFPQDKPEDLVFHFFDPLNKTPNLMMNISD